MNPVFTYIRAFYKKDFHPAYFLLILALLGLLIYLNYWHFLEIKYAAGSHIEAGRFMGYYLLYFIPFAIAFFIQPLFFKDCSYFKSPWFWIIFLLAPAIFSFRVQFDFHESFVIKFLKENKQQLWLRCISWVVRVFVVLIPVYIIWLIKDKRKQPFYGSEPLETVKPYMIMLLVMVPLIALAGTQKDFLQMYPKAMFLTRLDYPASAWHYILYEICYGFDFVSIEVFFRGFLILSLVEICGARCIIPVACFYCAIHLGKPMGEAVSSFFGGTLLGIVSFNTRSIWGGLIVHLGIAWMMELSGWLGNLYF